MVPFVWMKTGFFFGASINIYLLFFFFFVLLFWKVLPTKKGGRTGRRSFIFYFFFKDKNPFILVPFNHAKTFSKAQEKESKALFVFLRPQKKGKTKVTFYLSSKFFLNVCSSLLLFLFSQENKTTLSFPFPELCHT